MINYIGLFGMSCISAYIFNVFMETLYPRKYDNRRMYWLAYLAYIMISFGIGILKLPYVNVICTVLGMGMINGTLYHVKGRNPVINFILFFIYIILMMLPFQVIMLAQYLVLRELSLLDSLWAIILPGAFSTFPVFVLYNFFRAIPESIMESARIDGASEFQIFFKIGIPLGKTGIIAALLLQFLEYWNVVEQPLIFLDREELWPLTLYLPEISLENAGQSLVAAVITLVPTMILFFLCKDHLEKGIVASAVKE